MALNAAIALIVLGELPSFDAGTRGALLGCLLLIVLWSWLGSALTWLLRSTAATLTFLFAAPLLIEPLLTLLSSIPVLDWLTPVVRWLPFSAGNAMVAPALDGVGSGLSALEGGIVFAGMVVLFLAAGWIRFTSTDA